MVDYATVNIKPLLMLVKGHITILYKISIDLVGSGCWKS